MPRADRRMTTRTAMARKIAACSDSRKAEDLRRNSMDEYPAAPGQLHAPRTPTAPTASLAPQALDLLVERGIAGP